MKPASLLWALAATLKITFALVAPLQDAQHINAPASRAPAPIEGSTVFGWQEVPPMLEIEGPTFNDTVKNGYWLVKHYSPYCKHCKAMAPNWQMLYEFYYTSSTRDGPKGATNDPASPESFTGKYNFHFAEMNCIAWGDKCDQLGILVWPSLRLYKDGDLVSTFKGNKTLTLLTRFIEAGLEQSIPGSRPKDGIRIPKMGAHDFDPQNNILVLPEGDSTVPLNEEYIPPPPKLKPGEVAPAPSLQSSSATNAPTSALAIAVQRSQPSQTPEKAGPAPNRIGKSVSLTAESFQKHVTNSQDSWFIKFYAPWCSHCKRLAPTWSQLAKEMQGKLNIGEVNCEVESRLCREASVRAFPSMLFFRGGERVEYTGLRGLGDFKSYCEKALDSDIKYVDAAAFKEMEETEEVIFVYFFDVATTSEDFAALEKVTLSLIGHAKVVKTDSKILAERFKISTWPRLLVSRDGRPSYYSALAPKDMRDFRKVLGWMKTVWQPIVPELSASNAREIMNGKFVVLGVLTRDRPDDFMQSKRELKNAAMEWMDKRTQLFQLERQEMRDAKQLRIEEAEDRNDQRALRQAKSRVISITEEEFRKQVAFAWVDGVFWERWLKSTYRIDVSQGERVVIVDEDNRRYWDQTDSGAFIVPSRTSILETLPRVVSNPPKLVPKSTVGIIEKFFFHLRMFISGHPYISVIGLLSVVLTFLFCTKRGATIRSFGRSGTGYFQLDGKEGLLGGPNGKSD